jgi:hypothetical protein
MKKSSTKVIIVVVPRNRLKNEIIVCSEAKVAIGKYDFAAESFFGMF